MMSAPWSGRTPETAATSAEAAASIEEHLPYLEQLVFVTLKEYGPQTCDELEQRLGLSHQTTSARIRGLAIRERIRPSDERRPTRSGRTAVVWEIS